MPAPKAEAYLTPAERAELARRMRAVGQRRVALASGVTAPTLRKARDGFPVSARKADEVRAYLRALPGRRTEGEADPMPPSWHELSVAERIRRCGVPREKAAAIAALV